MSVDLADVFVILKWPAEAGAPRYSFATIPHAREIQTPVEQIRTCSSLEVAATLTAQLNAEDAAAAA